MILVLWYDKFWQIILVYNLKKSGRLPTERDYEFAHFFIFPVKYKDEHDMLNQKKKWLKTQKWIIPALGAGIIFHAAYAMGVSIVTPAVSG